MKNAPWTPPIFFPKILWPFLSYMNLLSQIPVTMNAVGGILVGLVTAYAGGVRKVSRCTWKESLTSQLFPRIFSNHPCNLFILCRVSWSSQRYLWQHCCSLSLTANLHRITASWHCLSLSQASSYIRNTRISNERSKTNNGRATVFLLSFSAYPDSWWNPINPLRQ